MPTPLCRSPNAAPRPLREVRAVQCEATVVYGRSVRQLRTAAPPMQRIALLLLALAALAAVRAQTTVPLATTQAPAPAGCDPATVPGGIYFYDNNHNAGLLTVSATGTFTVEQYFNRKTCTVVLTGDFLYDSATGAFNETLTSIEGCDRALDCTSLCCCSAVVSPIQGVISFASDAKPACSKGTMVLTGSSVEFKWRASSSTLVASLFLIAACLVLLL